MSLAAGTRLGPYEVLGLIGAGGMGEVYTARDTRLDRTVAIRGGSRTALAITQDGKRLVFAGRTGDVSRLYVRALDNTTASELTGTEGAESPVFSPDGPWIAFWAGGGLKKVPAGGGPVTVVCQTLTYPPFGLSWGDDGRIVFGLLPGGSMLHLAGGGCLPHPIGQSVGLKVEGGRLRFWVKLD